MSIMLSVLLFAIGVVLVVKGGDWFVDAASWIARAARVPPFIIGATIVSLATTLPELIVSVMASVEGKNDMAVGNALGSVTANTGLIMAIAFVFMNIVTPRGRYWRQCVLLVLTAGILWLGCIHGTVQPWACAALILIFFAFMITNVRGARREPQSAGDEKIEKTPTLIAKNAALFIIGAILIVIGSNLLIRGGSNLATALGIPERVVAITMVAIGTSLPELVTTITAIRKKESQLSIGNIIGANIIDLSLILPICALIARQGFAVSPQCLRIDFPVCFLITLMALLPIVVKERSDRLQGVLMLVIYGAYLIISI